MSDTVQKVLTILLFMTLLRASWLSETKSDKQRYFLIIAIILAGILF